MSDQVRLDYVGNGIWSVFRGDRPVPGQNVLMVGGGVKRLLEWCLDHGTGLVDLAPAARIVVELETDYARGDDRYQQAICI